MGARKTRIFYIGGSPYTARDNLAPGIKAVEKRAGFANRNRRIKIFRPQFAGSKQFLPFFGKFFFLTPVPYPSPEKTYVARAGSDGRHRLIHRHASGAIYGNAHP